MFFVLGNFLPFYPPNSLKNKNFKKLKKAPGGIILLHKFTKNHDHMLLCSWDMARDTCNCYFSFWAIFCPFTPLTDKNQNFKKKNNEKNFWRYHHFTHVHLKLWLDDVQFLRYGERWTGRETDGQTEKVTYRGGCPI